MTAAGEPAPLPDGLLAEVADVLAPGGWQAVSGRPSLFLRSNTALLSALRCNLTGDDVTVASVSMMFEEDRPLQLRMQPAGREALLAVCAALNRHAGRLDRLQHADCVAELLRHVPEVRIEAESGGLVPTVARMAGGTVRYEAAAAPVWPPPERSRADLNRRRRAGDADLLAWDAAQHKELPRLLAKDRRRSLEARLSYYERKELLRPSDGFVRTIGGGRHAVWFPGDDSKSAFAYSIGLGYLRDLPEILLVSPMPAMIGATSHALALMVNAIAAAMIDGVALKPGDRYGVVADRVASAVKKQAALDHASLAQSCFVVPSARIAERTLVSGAWFYANFMDTTSFPVLACLLQPPRVPETYGVPPPPPPAKVKRAAPPIKAAAKKKKPSGRKPPAKARAAKPAKKAGGTRTRGKKARR